MKSCSRVFLSGMKRGILALIVTGIAFVVPAYSQLDTNRIHYVNKNIFLNGINIAWVTYAGDLGPNPPVLSEFQTVFQEVRDNGGNALRLWLHINGQNSPQYDNNGYVTGPGPVAIRNLKEILALAQQYKVGLVLCLWSFDMLGKNEDGLDSALLYANQKMLTDTAYTMAYVRNALVPMVDSVKGDTAIIAWEVCNEPNGMTTGTNYYSGDPTVSISTVQQFTNLIAGGIHRADPGALVTTGPGSFQTLTDTQVPSGSIVSLGKTISSMSQAQLQRITDEFNLLHRGKLTPQEMAKYLDRVASVADSNYYRDDRLVAAGGDTAGKLDFYCVHYYNYGTTSLSPLVHPFSYWGLTKPTVVAEFWMQTTDGITDQSIYPTLYNNGYAGALAWSWSGFSGTPNNPTNAETDTWSALHYMSASFPQDVNVFGADWPTIAITSPPDGSFFPDSTQLALKAAVVDTGSSVTSVDFYVADSLLARVTTPSDTISDTLIYSFEWKSISAGTYTITAVATNGQGQQEKSNSIQFSAGTPQMTRLEAEKAAYSGSGISVKKNSAASGGAYLDIATQTGTITWTFVNYQAAGNYPIGFGYNLNYGTPKDQYILVNGTPVDTLDFDGSGGVWAEKDIIVPLVQDTNTVQMELYWGWMYLDYLAVPTGIVTSVSSHTGTPLTFSLSQNYPNPFNPSTTIKYQLAAPSHVTLRVYDVLGREVATLVDQRQSVGYYSAKFDGSRFSSGVYFYRISIRSNDGRNFVSTKKALLLK